MENRTIVGESFSGTETEELLTAARNLLQEIRRFESFVMTKGFESKVILELSKGEKVIVATVEHTKKDGESWVRLERPNIDARLIREEPDQSIAPGTSEKYDEEGKCNEES